MIVNILKYLIFFCIEVTIEKFSNDYMIELI